MQITGTQFTNTAALFGNDLATFPDYPAEIRAPAGTLPGVSGFQVQFSSADIYTPGDEPDVLVAMNPAALKVNLHTLPKNAIVIADADAFDRRNLQKAGYPKDVNPLEDGSLDGYRLFAVPLTSRTETALSPFEALSVREKRRCKNFYALGMAYWLFSRSFDNTAGWLEKKFKKRPEIAQANITAMKAGYAFCDASEEFQVQYDVAPAPTEPGQYRSIQGNQALAYGLVAASHQAGVPLFYGSYPITPASSVLETLARLKRFGVKTFQAEDEIAAVTSAIGAAFAGAIAATGSSGPGIALKGEALGLALMVELPLVVVNVQRAGPSTGMPTKTEQSDLMQAMYGRNGEAPVPILAPQSPSDCFAIGFEAVRIATKYMVPVFILSDGFIANGAEPWRLPESLEDLSEVSVSYREGNGTLEPYSRDEETLARPWVKPGTPGLEHRIGGLEKQNLTGNVSYDPANHRLMTELREKKVQRVASEIPDLEVHGAPEGDLLLVAWGSTYGACRQAVSAAVANGLKVGHVHLRHLNPFPANLPEVMARFKRVACVEINSGQLATLLRAKYLVDVHVLGKVEGQPFAVREVLTHIQELAS